MAISDGATLAEIQRSLAERLREIHETHARKQRRIAFILAVIAGFEFFLAADAAWRGAYWMMTLDLFTTAFCVWRYRWGMLTAQQAQRDADAVLPPTDGGVRVH